MAVGQKKTGLLPIDYQSFSYESQTSQTHKHQLLFQLQCSAVQFLHGSTDCCFCLPSEFWMQCEVNSFLRLEFFFGLMLSKLCDGSSWHC